jgi:hypothetical protein
LKNKCRLFLLLLAAIPSLQAQILDDSSRQTYSIRTVFIRTQKEMMQNRGQSDPDTNLEGFSEKLDFLRKDGRDYQNLGTFGSASRPLLYELPESIGKRNGMNAYDVLYPGLNDVPYFKTLSPYSRIRYMQGARQRSILQTTFSVNPIPNLNLAGHYQRFSTLRVLNVTEQDENETDHHSLWLSSNYQSKNGKYSAWGHYQLVKHAQFQTGGAKAGGPGFADSLFEFTNIMQTNLGKDARNRDVRDNWHFSHVFRIGAGFYLSSIHSRLKQITYFRDPRPDSLYYGKENFFFQEGSTGTPDALFIERTFEVVENTGGAGWQDTARTVFLYVKRRDWAFTNSFYPGSRKGVDLFAGLQHDGRIQSLHYNLKAEFLDKDEFDLNAGLSWKGLRLKARSISFRPSMVQESFQSKNLLYENRLLPGLGLQFGIEKLFTWKTLKIKPRMEWISVRQGIAFDSTFKPFQTSGTTRFLYPGIDIELSLWKRIHSSARITRPIQTGPKIAGIPGYMLFTSLYVDLIKKKKSYAVQPGLSLEWRNDWNSELFAAPNAQWYIQQRLSVPTYFMVNTFVQFRIDRVRLYFRVHNTLQGLGGKGYVAAPGYPAQRRLFELGIDWTFFD